jgi:hypothetical protein
LQGSSPHTIFYDVTHDNETPLDKRTAEDALSTGALVLFTSAAAGSVKGFDDLYPKLLNLVTDTRAYEVVEGNEGNSGIGKVKRVLNHLHQEMMIGGYVEGHVHQEGDVSIGPEPFRLIKALIGVPNSSTSFFTASILQLAKVTCLSHTRPFTKVPKDEATVSYLLSRA